MSFVLLFPLEIEVIVMAELEVVLAEKVWIGFAPETLGLRRNN